MMCAGIEATLLLFVPPHSLAAVLADAAQTLGSGRRCVVARELTKVCKAVINLEIFFPKEDALMIMSEG